MKSDSELITSAQKGDSRALDELLTRHEKQVYRFGLRMCGSEEAAREVLQRTLLTAFKGIRDFRGEAALSTWLYQIARSFCLKERRKRASEPDVLESLDAPAALAVASQGEGPEERAHARQVGEMLQAAIQALPPRLRETLILRDVEGLSAEEAAQVMGIEVGALKSRLHRARMELRRHLSALLEPQPGCGADFDCPELLEALTVFREADIDQAACERIEAHMARCPRCTEACESLKRTVSLCRAIPGNEVPAPVRAAVRQAVAQLTGVQLAGAS